MQDWTGNSKSTYVTLGASNHTDKERESNDYYATDPKALELLLDRLAEDKIKLNRKIWECACGGGHLARALKARGYEVASTDLVDRGYGVYDIDFLRTVKYDLDSDILTNPPYKYAQDFIEHALDMVKEGNHVIMLLKIQFVEGKRRRALYDKQPPKYIYVFSTRQNCAMNGDFDTYKTNSAVCYAWYIWEKGWKGDTILRWI